MSFSDFIHKFEDLDKFGEGGKTLHMNNHRYEAIKFYKESTSCMMLFYQVLQYPLSNLFPFPPMSMFFSLQNLLTILHTNLHCFCDLLVDIESQRTQQ